ncbi:MAG: hypothetical protein M1838_000822 [Thelocarpon superellum]|nr:MAG: hypothetical protein M1838_000822 [Thelocarpon superellum]
MKYSVIALAAVVATASAQLPSIPSCATSCFITALSGDGCASLTDFKCHCSKGSQLTATVEPCLIKSCTSQSDLLAAAKAVSDTCASVGEPIAVPSTMPSSSAAAPASSASSSAAPPKSSAPASSAPAASAGSSTTTALTTYTTTSCSSTGAAAATGVAPTGGITGNSTSAIPFTGAASQLTASAATSFVALALVALYAL